jgi:hypothetical protein
MAFRVGQKVARVSGRQVAPWVPPVDAVCTVSWVGWEQGQEVINIHEYPAMGGAFHKYYLAQFFRPITEKKTDIAIFHRILDKVNKRETVNG